MGRNGSGVYSLPPGSTVADGDTSDADDVNTPLADIVADLNAVRPVVAGGTGVSSISDLKTALGITGVSFDANGKLTIDPTTTSNSYHSDTSAFALNVSNGDIVDINALYWSDESSSVTEGLMFPNTASPADAGDYSSLRAYQSKLLFAPAADSTVYEVFHENNVTDAAEALLEGSTAPTASNLDTLSEPGMYSVADSATGAPSGSFDAAMMHMESTGQSTQLLVTGEDIIYHRVDDGSGYGDWSRIQTDSYNVRDVSPDYESSEVALPSAGTRVSFSHGLGSTPRLWMIVLRFTGAEGGYAADNEVLLVGSNSSGNKGWSAFAASSAIYFRPGSSGPFLTNDTNGNEVDLRGSSNVQVSVRAWL